jgi:plastocyanin
MTRRLPILLSACCALLLASGCGSSKSTSTAGAGTKTRTTGTVKEGLVADGKISYASPPVGAPVQSGPIKITYREFAIEPDTVKAKVGSTLKWTNDDTEKCNVKSEGGPYTFDSGNLPEGGSFELKLDKPGTIHYECTYYPTTMNGAIQVVT